MFESNVLQNISDAIGEFVQLTKSHPAIFKHDGYLVGVLLSCLAEEIGYVDTIFLHVFHITK